MAEQLWVLDTSVAVAWFFDEEPLKRKALEVQTVLIDQPQRFVIPHLFYTELLHALARKSRRDRSFIERALRLSLSIGLRMVALGETALIRAVHWSVAGLSGYDATFVALAEDLDARWLTADEQALKIVGKRYGASLKAWSKSISP